MAIGGSQEDLIIKLQHRYGFLRLDAEKQVIEWGTKMNNLLSRPHEPIVTNDDISGASGATGATNGVSDVSSGANDASSGANSASGVSNGVAIPAAPAAPAVPPRRLTLVEQDDSDEITSKVNVPAEKLPEPGPSQDSVPMDKLP